jgi:hypothetical protein
MAVAEASARSQQGRLSWSLAPFTVCVQFNQAPGNPREPLQ